MTVKTLLGVVVVGLVALTVGCVPPPAGRTTRTTTSTTTTTTTSTLPTPPGTVTVSPTVETPDRQPAGVNDADDAAIWVHPTDSSQSLIIATIKVGGLEVYRLDGTVVQTIGAGGGRFNNVDLVYPVVAGDHTSGLAIVSDRATDKLHVFRVDGRVTPPVTEVTATNVPLVFGTTQPVTSKTAYGVAAWRTPAGTVEVFVSQENTTNVQKVVLSGVATASVSYQKVGPLLSLPNTFRMPDGSSWTPCFNPSHPDWQAHVEGMVVDPTTGVLWADQELVGLWRITTDLGSSQLVHKITRYGQTWTVSDSRCSVDSSSTSYGDAFLPGDLEGIGLYRAGSGSAGYLIMSNQDSSLFTVLDRNGGAYRGSFKVGSAGSIDAVDKTDGLAVVDVPLGTAFPSGLVITQDGKNAPEGGTNFKFTPWQSIASPLGLTVNAGGSPRA